VDPPPDGLLSRLAGVLVCRSTVVRGANSWQVLRASFAAARASANFVRCHQVRRLWSRGVLQLTSGRAVLFRGPRPSGPFGPARFVVVLIPALSVLAIAHMRVLGGSDLTGAQEIKRIQQEIKRSEELFSRKNMSDLLISC